MVIKGDNAVINNLKSMNMGVTKLKADTIESINLYNDNIITKNIYKTS